ncbi:MAG: hypothetical protein ACD_81C00186G0014 [uncultured bacterium]|uniref:Uncharacterized protein n=1 Tax=Candidatus Wolfebacteria bacterium GW2011_GWE2_44_13 TaxID=1619017 RepID=A0A0G1JIF7_9BACT|nr:MAG: hypothetical protein ACD_81C00186G0014 [uncultured bacterium]KKT43767.1 MAG: hypothetical protein UW32_C0001G0359 [Candidatus Wolfebacteria bacterium GW2011_GWE2_44_13]
MATKNQIKIFCSTDLTSGGNLSSQRVEETLNLNVARWQAAGEDNHDITIEKVEMRLDVQCVTAQRQAMFADFTIAAIVVVTYTLSERSE